MVFIERVIFGSFEGIEEVIMLIVEGEYSRYSLKSKVFRWCVS